MVVLGTFVPSRIPKQSRRGDGLGCRKCDHCRHCNTWQQREHFRTVRRRRALRAARQAHPRNR